MTDRLAALEAQAAALNAEIAALRATQPAPPPRPPRDDGVRVTELLTECTAGMPTPKELQLLYGAVMHLAPWPLADKYDERKPFRGFCSAFRWLSNKGRTDVPNSKYALSFWLDNCRSWLRARDAMANDVNAGALILATYAHGDVKYCPANAALGCVWELALAEYAGKPASPDSWKRILREGASAVLPPSAPARRIEAPSPVRVYGAW
jgi:hypothetical protein